MSSRSNGRTQGIRPAEGLTREQIVAVATRMIDEGAPLNGGSVAAELGVTRNAVSWHVNSMIELRGLVATEWLGTLATGPSDRANWAGGLRDVAWRYREAAHNHPNLGLLVADTFAINDQRVFLDQVVADIDHTGLPRDDRALACNAFVSAIIGFVHLELTECNFDGAAARQARSITRRGYVGLGPSWSTAQESFAYLVDSLLEGFQARLARGARPVHERTCEVCGKVCETSRGLAVHGSRAHGNTSARHAVGSATARSGSRGP